MSDPGKYLGMWGRDSGNKVNDKQDVPYEKSRGGDGRGKDEDRLKISRKFSVEFTVGFRKGLIRVKGRVKPEGGDPSMSVRLVWTWQESGARCTGL